MITSTAATSAPPVHGGADPWWVRRVMARVPTLMDSLLHDVRNPLNALAIHLEVLSGEAQGGDRRRCRRPRRRTSRPCASRSSAWTAFSASSPSSSSRAAALGRRDLSEVVPTRSLDVLGHEGRSGARAGADRPSTPECGSAPDPASWASSSCRPCCAPSARSEAGSRGLGRRAREDRAPCSRWRTHGRRAAEPLPDSGWRRWSCAAGSCGVEFQFAAAQLPARPSARLARLPASRFHHSFVYEHALEVFTWAAHEFWPWTTSARRARRWRRC